MLQIGFRLDPDLLPKDIVTDITPTFMKSLPILIVAATATLALASCGGSYRGSTVSADSLATDYNVGEPVSIPADCDSTAATVDPYLLTSQGVAGLRIEMARENIPDSMAGFYNKVTVTTETDEEEGDITLATFTIADTIVAAAGELADGRLRWLRISSPAVKVRVGDRLLGVGSTAAELECQRGVRRIDDPYGASPQAYEWRDIIFETEKSDDGRVVGSLFITSGR